MGLHLNLNSAKKRSLPLIILLGYIFNLIFIIFWGYNHILWTKSDPTLFDEQACFDAFGIYTTAKIMHQKNIHPQQVCETLWGPLPYYLYAKGMDIFGERLSSIRKTTAFFSGYWGGFIYLIIFFATRRPVFSFFITLLFIPFSGHINFAANRGYAHFYTFIMQALSMLIMLIYTQRKRIWLLVLIGMIQGFSFGFKYELSLLGLFATLMALYLFEIFETYDNLIKTQSFSGQKNNFLTLRIIKILPLMLIIIYTIYLAMSSFLPVVLLIFWLACIVILFFEFKLIGDFRKRPVFVKDALRPLMINILAVSVPFILAIIFWFLHLWQNAGLQIAKEYFMNLVNISGSVARMRFSSQTFSANNLTYFIINHPIIFSQVIGFCAYAFISSWVLFFIKDIIIKGITVGLTVFILFETFQIPQINLFSIYYFIAAMSIFLWLYFLNIIRKPQAYDIAKELVVYLCFLAVGSLSLLRESASLDLNVWSMLPPLLGILFFLTSSPIFSKAVTWVKTASFSAIFYFVAVGWLNVESLNYIYSIAMPPGKFQTVDSEFDLLIPKETALGLQQMKSYFQQHLGSDEYIFVFSDHIYPYLFTRIGVPTDRIISFQAPNKQKETRMLQLFRAKKIKYVLFSNGVVAYNSAMAAKMFPELHDFIAKNYTKTNKSFLNFVVYQNINATHHEE